MIYSFLYVCIFSFAMILIQSFYISIPPTFSLLVTAAITTLYFNIINIHKIKFIYSQCWSEKKLFFGIMCTVLIMWNCSMVGPGLIGASLYNFLYFSWLGALGFLSLGIFNINPNKLKIYCGFLACLLIIFVIWNYLSHATTKQALEGVSLALIGGSTAFIYFKQSQTLTKRIKLSATQILAVRFYLTIIIMLIILPKENIISNLNVANLIKLTLLAFSGLIIPLYFQQKALEDISSEQNAIIISLAPIMMAVLEEFRFRDVNLHYTIVYLSYTLIVTGAYVANKYLSLKVKK